MRAGIAHGGECGWVESWSGWDRWWGRGGGEDGSGVEGGGGVAVEGAEDDECLECDFDDRK